MLAQSVRVTGAGGDADGSDPEMNRYNLLTSGGNSASKICIGFITSVNMSYVMLFYYLQTVLYSRNSLKAKA